MTRPLLADVDHSLDEIVRAIVAPFVDASHALHVHHCGYRHAEGDDTCERVCVCSCGAQLAMSATYTIDGKWDWLLRDGSRSAYPDPRDRVNTTPPV